MFIDLNEYLTVNTDWIKGIRQTVEGQTIVYINLAGMDETETTNLPFSFLKSILQTNRDKSEIYLKQLASQSQQYVG